MSYFYVIVAILFRLYKLIGFRQVFISLLFYVHRSFGGVNSLRYPSLLRYSIAILLILDLDLDPQGECSG